MTMLALAEKVPLIYENPGEFSAWLDRMAKAGVISYKVERYRRKDGEVILWKLKGRSGINTGVSTSVDPLNNLVLLGFAFFGQYWVFLPDTDDAFKFVRKWWREQVKRGRRF